MSTAKPRYAISTITGSIQRLRVGDHLGGMEIEVRGELPVWLREACQRRYEREMREIAIRRSMESRRA